VRQLFIDTTKAWIVIAGGFLMLALAWLTIRQSSARPCPDGDRDCDQRRRSEPDRPRRIAGRNRPPLPGIQQHDQPIERLHR
jgi:hypothetical protein